MTELATSIHSTVPDSPLETKIDVDWVAYRLKQFFPRMNGKENARTSDELMRWMGIQPKGTNQRLRAAAKKLFLEEHHPLISCTAGFYIAKNRQEMVEHVESMRQRAIAILKDVKEGNDQIKLHWGEKYQPELFNADM